ncbi:TPA: glycosyltransferase family 25 protein [Citrobacter sedlakii]
MSYHTYVISLHDQVLRKSNIKKELDLLGINFEFVDAIDCRTSSLEYLQSEYNVTKNSNASINRSLTRGEIGCVLSHIQCYKDISSRDSSWGLILEDDAIISRLSNDKITAMLSLADSLNTDLIILGYSKLDVTKADFFCVLEPIKVEAKNDSFKLGHPWKEWTCGTVGYLIKKNGARKILDIFHSNGICTVADDWEYLKKSADLKITHVRPLLVFEDFENLPSSIQDERLLVSKKSYGFLDFFRLARGLLRKGVFLFK